MSHLEERKEKICLNCGTQLYGRYCHVCGQENVEPKETVWHLVNHFFEDITHFDGKFFSTGKYLLTKPGFLSLEYINGRRASYLNPIRMYVFTSAIFFLLFFSLTNADNVMKIDEQPGKEKKESVADWEKEKTELLKQLEQARLNKDADSSDVVKDIYNTNFKINAAKKFYSDTTTRKFSSEEIALLLVRAGLDSIRAKGVPDSVANAVDHKIAKKDSSKSENNWFLDDRDSKFGSPEAYDSAQEKLPVNKRDGWAKRIFKRKLVAVNNEVKKDRKGYVEHFKERFFHSFPKILFVSLPFFALILKLVYIRRKQFYYTSHGIFTIHLYCATFILLLVMILLGQLQHLASWKWLQTVVTILDIGLWIYIFLYLYKAMRKFYAQGRFKTILKYLVVCLLALIVNVLLLAIFILISAISV